MIGGISIWQLLILLAIVVLVFGTKRIRNLGGDLGSALKDFKGAMKQNDDDEGDDAHKKTNHDARKHPEDPQIIDQPGRTEPGAGSADEADKHDADKRASENRPS